MSYQRDYCRICLGQNLTNFLSLGSMPIPNGFISHLGEKEKFYPLGVNVCLNCTLIQLTHVIPAELMFKNYLYIPSTSQTMLKHFEVMADWCVQQYKIKKDDLVIDIGSNDGTLLRYFKAYEADVLGVDPATNLVKVARLNGINTVDKFFSKKLATTLNRKYGPARLVIATNVVAHVDDLHDFFEGIKILIDQEGIFVAEFPYALDMIKKNEFDTIYHEHLSYFTVKSLNILLNKLGLKLINVKKQSIHGGSIRIFVVHEKSRKPVSPEVKQFLDSENDLNLSDLKQLQLFAERVEEIKINLVTMLKEFRARGKRVVGYGAAAKGNVLLNYCQITTKLVDYIVDSVSYKQGKYTPGTHIPIFAEKKLENNTPDYLLILAWNFAEEIIHKQGIYRERGGQFIITIPSLRIE